MSKSALCHDVSLNSIPFRFSPSSTLTATEHGLHGLHGPLNGINRVIHPALLEFQLKRIKGLLEYDVKS